MRVQQLGSRMQVRVGVLLAAWPWWGGPADLMEVSAVQGIAVGALELPTACVDAGAAGRAVMAAGAGLARFHSCMPT